MKTIIKIFVLAVVISIIMILPWKTVVPPYKVQQTVEALKDVRNLHVIKRNESGHIEVERWIEINADGTQDKYFQETVGQFVYLEDASIRLIYIIENNTILLYDRGDTSITWISGFNELFKDMAKDDSVNINNIKHNDYELQMVQWSKYDVECYINAETNLPVLVGRDEIYYEQMPENIFDKLQILFEKATIVDKRETNNDGSMPDLPKGLKLNQKNLKTCDLSTI